MVRASVSVGSQSRRGASPLESPAIGTATNDLIEPCDGREADRNPLPPPPRDPAIALAFSGGGFRATLTALGVLRFAADAGLLPQVRYVSSVSGGSLANGLFAHHYSTLQREAFSAEALDDLVIRPFIKRITTQSLSRAVILNLWRAAGPSTRTDLLAKVFDDWFFEKRLLEDLPPGCRFIVNTANLTTGVRFGFEREVLGDWVLGLAKTAGTRIRLSQAVAASAAVPGAFAPFIVKGVRFPCANGRVPKLVDGGAYDNSGLEAVDDLPETLLIAANAGGLFRAGAYAGVPIIRDLQRANSLLYRQSTSLRRREMVERFRAREEAVRRGRDVPEWARRGVLFGLATTFEPARRPPEEWTDSRPEDSEQWREHLATYKTSFTQFSEEICRRLIYRGWWLAGATTSLYHRKELPAQLPAWRNLAMEAIGGTHGAG